MVTVTKQQVKSKSENVIEVLEFCKTSGIDCRLVGAWLWVKYDSPPPANVRENLKAIGFRFSRRRQQWFHNLGKSSRPARNYRPWDKYETVSLDEACRNRGI